MRTKVVFFRGARIADWSPAARRAVVDEDASKLDTLLRQLVEFMPIAETQGYGSRWARMVDAMYALKQVEIDPPTDGRVIENAKREVYQTARIAQCAINSVYVNADYGFTFVNAWAMRTADKVADFSRSWFDHDKRYATDDAVEYMEKAFEAHRKGW